MTTFSAADERYMQRALRLARRGLGRVEPNPMVGCVIVAGNAIIGEGWHRRFGGPHAEIDALRSCRRSPRGTTVYVTLEPCRHFGKTPPCTTALLEAGVRRVVAPTIDPNPPVAGGGFALLRKAGVQVDVGLCAAEASELIAPFVKLVRQRLPWVILKWAQSLDGKIAATSGDAKWISDDASRAHAHRVRGRMDAIVVGIGTVLADDPMLTCRVGRPKRVATRVVLDRRLRTPLDARLVRTAGEVPTWVFCGRDVPQRRMRALAQAGCKVSAVPATRDGVSLRAVLRALARAGAMNVLVEGGGRVLGAFHDQRLADEAHVYIAPVLLGGAAALSPLHGRGVATVAKALRLPGPLTPVRVGDGLVVQTRLRPSL